jgi:chromosome segregation ATPase
MSSHTKEIILDLRSERATLNYDLEKLKLSLDSALNDKSHLNAELIKEKKKVENLLLLLKKGNLNSDQLKKYKFNSQNLEFRINNLMNEIENYKKKIEETNSELTQSKASNDTLSNSNKDLSQKLKEAADKLSKASKLSFYSFETKSFKKRNSGELVPTERASRIDLFKISFIIRENELANTQTKKFYIQITDEKNNIIGNNETTTLGEKISDYTAIITTRYNKKNTQVEKEIPVKDLESGNYIINVFDGENLIYKSNFSLK